MAITLELPPRTEALLMDRAAAKGLPVEALLERLIAKEIGEAQSDQERSPAETLHRLTEIAHRIHALPRLDHATRDEIFAFDENGIPAR